MKFILQSKNLLIFLTLLIISALSIIGTIFILSSDSCESCAVYNAIAFVVIMLWTAIFISYFIWATYFYNLNYGTSKSLWERIEKEKEKKASGKTYDPDVIDDEPLYNPYKDETFGLPPGTVRGMIAFTLLFGSIALLIVSFGMKNVVEPGSFVLDQFEFFKTAFLMMIAFYFGSSSLKYLKDGKQLSPFNTANSQKKGTTNGSTASVSVPETVAAIKKSEFVVIDSSNPLGASAPDEKMPPITAIDPMA